MLLYALAPLIALVAVGGLIAVLRWTFSGESLELHREIVTAEDYGLLRAAVVVDDPASAEAVRQRLTDAGIRCTTAVGRDRRVRVLVFADELEKARRVVG
ncbi:MAG TPA: hypothetical protein VF054_01490 [Micromonosporaceae bacterium]